MLRLTESRATQSSQTFLSFLFPASISQSAEPKRKKKKQLCHTSRVPYCVRFASTYEGILTAVLQP